MIDFNFSTNFVLLFYFNINFGINFNIYAPLIRLRRRALYKFVLID